MKKITRTIDIKAPAQRVFDFLTHPENLPGVWPRLVSVSNIVARGDGVNDFDWVYKMAHIPFKGRSVTEEARPGKLLRVKNTGGIASTFRWTFEGVDGSGSRITMEAEYDIPQTLLGKVAESIITRSSERDAETLLHNVKDVVESGQTTITRGAEV
jgi:uncharacterized protein YndB with AHSA1/START domain